MKIHTQRKVNTISARKLASGLVALVLNGANEGGIVMRGDNILIYLEDGSWCDESDIPEMDVEILPKGTLLEI